MIKKLFLFILLFSSAVSHSAIFGDGDPSNGIEDQRHLASSPFLKAVGTIFCDGVMTYVSVFTCVLKTGAT